MASTLDYPFWYNCITIFGGLRGQLPDTAKWLPFTQATSQSSSSVCHSLDEDLETSCIYRVTLDEDREVETSCIFGGTVVPPY